MVNGVSLITIDESGYVPNWGVNSNKTLQAFNGTSCGFTLGAFNGCVYEFEEWRVNEGSPVRGAYSFQVSGKPTIIIAVYRTDYTSLEIASVLFVVVVFSVIYLKPKKHRRFPKGSTQITETRGLMYKYGYLTDVGNVRSNNEDSVIAMEISAAFSSRPTSALLCAIADGVGGAQKGEVASMLAIQTITAEVLRMVGSVTDRLSILKASIEAANDAVGAYGMEHSESEGLATTIVASFIENDTAYVAHAGDSRVYLVNRAGIKQLTKDHSHVQDLVDSRQITQEQARHDPRRNVITRAVGGATDIQVDTTWAKLEPGDRVLLCSDGLWEPITDEEIHQIIFQSTDSQSACNRLVLRAKEQGGRDNISVVIVEIQNPPNVNRASYIT
jgi:protein phosphatase